MDPIKVVALGYGFYILLGFLVLSLPWAQATATPWLDRLFMAVSTVTTTGLAPHDPGATYTLFGELALLAMMQVGALGYLTLGTFVAVSLSDRMSKRRTAIARAAFGFLSKFRPNSRMSLLGSGCVETRNGATARRASSHRRIASASGPTPMIEIILFML